MVYDAGRFLSSRKRRWLKHSDRETLHKRLVQLLILLYMLLCRLRDGFEGRASSFPEMEISDESLGLLPGASGLEVPQACTCILPERQRRRFRGLLGVNLFLLVAL